MCYLRGTEPGLVNSNESETIIHKSQLAYLCILHNVMFAGKFFHPLISPWPIG